MSIKPLIKSQPQRNLADTITSKWMIIVLICVLLITCNEAPAQTKKDTLPPKVTAQAALTDTTVFLSLSDLMRLSDQYKDRVTGRQWEMFSQIFNAVINDAIADYNRKHPIKK